MSNPRAAQLVEAGMWLRLSGDHEGAKRLFDQALKLDPDNARAKELLAAGNGPPPSAPAAPTAPVAPPRSEPDNPFAPAPTTTAVDLDWGSATGFAPTPVPFIPPVAARPAPSPEPEPDLPVELDIDTVAPPVFGEPTPGNTLVFGGSSSGDAFPDPAPTAPEQWAQPQPSSPTMMFSAPGGAPASGAGGDAPVSSSSTMMFSPAGGSGTLPLPQDDLPWGAPPEPDPVPGASTGGTMQFPQPGALTPIPPGPASGAGGTMQFPRPAEPQTGGSTMQFMRPSEVPMPSVSPAQPAGTGTMQFARGDVAPQGTGTMQFAVPTAALPEDNNWEVVSSPSAVFAIPPAIAPVGAGPVAPAVPAMSVPPPSEPKFAPNATSAWDQRSNPGIKISDIAPGLGAALDLVSADRPHLTPPPVKSKLDEVKTLLRGAKDLLGLDDHTGAMDLILKAQELAPNDPEVQALRAKSEATLEAMFESKIGKLTAAPRVKLKDDEIIWLNLDHRAGFVLAQIDGSCTFEDLFSVSGMSRLDTARILAQLIEEGVITS